MYTVQEALDYLLGKTSNNGRGYTNVAYLGRRWFKKCCGKRIEKFYGVAWGIKVVFPTYFDVCLECGKVHCRGVGNQACIQFNTHLSEAL